MARTPRNNAVLDAMKAFSSTYGLVRGVMSDSAMADAAKVQPETIEGVKVSDNTKGVEGMIQDAETGRYVPKMFDTSGNMTDAGLAQVNATEGGETITGVDPTFKSETTKQYRLGGKTQDQPFTPDQIGLQRLRNMADVALQFGDPVKAAQFGAVSTQLREASRQDEIQSILAGDKLGGIEGLTSEPSRQAVPTSSDAIPVSAASGVPTSVGTNVGKQPQQTASAAHVLPKKSYLDVVSPRVQEAYLRQGKVAEAKAWRDFSDSENGRAYANDFSRALQLVTAGNYAGAAPVLQALFNNRFPNGQQANVENLGDGNFKIDIVEQASGKLIGSKTMAGAEMGRLAIGALNPTKLVEFTVQQQAKRDSEAALLDRQRQLETLRQQGQEAREDRRDERLDRRLDLQSEILDRRLAAQRESGGLSLSQQRQNEEIDAARESIAGLSPQEITQRTAKTTNTGRENPLFDATLERAVRLAGRRKIGSDDLFDRRQNAQGTSEALAGKPLADMTEQQLQRFHKAAGPTAKTRIEAELTRRAFMGDQTMSGYRLGGMTPKGYEVFDQSGKLIGHYSR